MPSETSIIECYRNNGICHGHHYIALWFERADIFAFSSPACTQNGFTCFRIASNRSLWSRCHSCSSPNSGISTLPWPPPPPPPSVHPQPPRLARRCPRWTVKMPSAVCRSFSPTPRFSCSTWSRSWRHWQGCLKWVSCRRPSCR